MSRIARWTWLAALAIPLATIMGWVLGIPLLTQWHPSLPAMQPNTVVGLLLCAVAVTPSRRRPGTVQRGVAAAAGVLAVVLGLATLLEYFLSRDLGLDRVLPLHPSLTPNPFPGRPAPQTAANLVLVGWAAVVLSVRVVPAYLCQIITLLAGGNSLVVLTGFLVDPSLRAGLPVAEIAIGMAANTAICFALLSSVLMTRTAGHGVMALLTSPTRSGAMSRRIFIVAIVAPPLLGGATRLGMTLGWYGSLAQISLFLVSLVASLLVTTWRSARLAERQELRAEAEHRERQIFEALVATSSDFIGIADPSGMPIYVNPKGRRMVGLEQDEVRKTRIPDYYSGDQREFALKVILPTMIRSGHWSGETVFKNWKTGEPIPVLDEHFLIRAPNSDELLGMGTISRDIRERKKADDRILLLAEVARVLNETNDLQERLERAATITVPRVSDLCVIGMMEDGEHRFKSAAIRDPAMLDRLRAEAPWGLASPGPFRTLAALEERKPILLEDVQAAIDAGADIEPAQVERIEMFGVTSFVILPLITGAGSPVGTMSLAMTRDSGRRFSREDLAFCETLANRIAMMVESARLLREAGLAKIEALSEVKTREEVLAIVSHDLKNPLGAILLATQLLRRGMLPEDEHLRKTTDTIERAASQMQRLIADLLDFARLRSGTFPLDLVSETPLGAVLAAMPPLRALAEEKKVTLTIEVGKDLPPIRCDPFRFGQVLSNLVGNAIKFNRHGGHVRVRAEPSGEFVRFFVEDDGPGLSPVEAAHVFERYWQAERTRRLGSGLGLSIAKGIVEAHRGSIGVESGRGRGATFYFSIPVAVGLTKSHTKGAA